MSRKSGTIHVGVIGFRPRRRKLEAGSYARSARAHVTNHSHKVTIKWWLANLAPKISTRSILACFHWILLLQNKYEKQRLEIENNDHQVTGTMNSNKGKEDRHFVTALARGLDLLHAFRSGEERLSNQDLADRCRLPKSTVTRLTYTLTKLGFLHHITASGRYRLGLATLTLGGTTLSRLDVKEASNRPLQELADKVRVMTTLSIRDELSMLHIENFRSQSSIVTLRLEIGSRLPIGNTAVGRAYLAAASSETRQVLVDRLTGIDASNRPSLEAEIHQAIQDLATIGCTKSFGEWNKEINAIAIPMRLGNELPTLVVGAAAPAKSVSAKAFIADIRPLLIEATRRIEQNYHASAS